MVTGWLSENFIELFGAVTGIAYVILEIRRNIWLWPLGIVTSAVYMYVFADNGFYANMGLQGYYLVISVYGWYAWRSATTGANSEAHRRAGNFNDPEARRASGIVEPGLAHSPENSEACRASSIVEPGNPTTNLPPENSEIIDGALQDHGTDVRRIGRSVAVWSGLAAAVLWGVLWYFLDSATDSPVPLWDGLIASLSVVATWMLTRKYLEQWYVWIVANAIAVVVYVAAGLYPTAVLFFVYFVMAIIGLREWAGVKAAGSRQ